MTNLRCPACSLLNPVSNTVCRRCGTELSTSSAEDVWRDGSLLVLKKGAALPERCVRCNAATQGAVLKKTFYWHHPGLYVLAFLALLIYALVALAVRKSVTVNVGLCPHHRSQRRWAIAGSSLLAIVGVVLLIAAIEGGAWLGWSGLAMIVGGAVWGSLGARLLAVKRVDDTYASFGGVCEEYLAQLPTWNAF